MSGSDRDQGSPWWSSGAEDIDDAADPFESFRSARAGGQDRDRAWDVPWEDWDDRDPPPPGGAQRSAVDDAFEAVQALARFVAARSGGRSAVRPHPRDQACRACPWCIAMRSLGDARPEVIDHLDEALRHLVAAARAWVEAAESRGQWERIELDDDPLGDDPLGDDPGGSGQDGPHRG